MSDIAKVIEISASSGKGIEDAIQSGLQKVAKTVSNLRGAWVSDIKVCTEPDGRVKEWRIEMKVTFIVQ